MDIEGLWSRLRDGCAMVALGRERLEAPDEPPALVVSIDCARHSRPFEPLLAACDRVHFFVDRTRPAVAPARRLGLRHRLLEDERDPANALVESTHRLARQIDVPLVLAFTRAASMGAGSATLLASLVDANALPAGLLVVCAKADPGPAVQVLVRAIKAREGDTAVVREVLREVAPRPSGAPSVEELLRRQADELDVNIVRMLRAGAIVGDAFEVGFVAALLGRDPVSVLEMAQLARDRGLPLEDLGAGVFRLSAEDAAALRASVTPSLAEAWHRQLTAVMSDDAVGGVGAHPPSEAGTTRGPGFLEGRAAHHAEAAGEEEIAAERYLEAARQAAALGGRDHALALVERSMRLLRPVPAVRLLRARTLIELGALRWRADEPALEDALSAFDQAQDALRAGDPVDLLVEARVLSAHVLYDMGEQGGLERALTQFGEARDLLQRADRPLDAARLLNDEAAVRVRLGQRDQAAKLLIASRGVFREYADHSDLARRELAETEHLVARLVLHEDPDQVEPQTVAFAVASAETSARRYEALGDPRAQARVWETRGRLDGLRGAHHEAVAWLGRAAEVQRELGDVLGLARTSGSLATRLAKAGRTEEALVVLGDSIGLNCRKGVTRGLAHNAAALDALEATLPPAERSRLAAPLAALRAKLSCNDDDDDDDR